MTETPPKMMGYEATVEGGVRRIVKDSLENDVQGRDIEALVLSVSVFAAGTAQDLAAKQPPPKPIACTGGCHFCCITTEVHASPLEVLRIARLVEATYDFTEQAKLLARLREWVQARMILTPKPVRRLCPLLEGGHCGVYAARPMVCRSFNSYDASVCERHKLAGDETPIKGYVHQERIHQATLLGMVNGANEAGRAGDCLDLPTALLKRLTDPKTETRWLAGFDEFEDARVRPNS